MGISESKKKIVIDNYFKRECDVNTSIKEAFTKGFELGLKKAPTPQPKTGHWEVVSDGYRDNAYICECSECKDTVWVYKGTDRKWSYCPSCGAKMVETQESEDQV